LTPGFEPDRGQVRRTEAESSGQTATIGYQDAGGASAAARPINCDGKVLDDNTPLDAWSIDVGLPTGTALAGYMDTAWPPLRVEQRYRLDR
jgi:hypothetical protein